MKRIVRILEEYQSQKALYKQERAYFLRMVLALWMSASFIIMRMLLIFLILREIEAGNVLWLLFWAQIPFVLGLDLVEKWVCKRG